MTGATHPSGSGHAPVMVTGGASLPGMRLRRYAIALALAVPAGLGVTASGVPGAGTATAASVAAVPAPVPDPLSPEPLARAALVAMPAVWRVEVTTHLAGLRTRDGTVITLPSGARSVGREGTAFGVTPDGYLITAAHVVQPSAADLAEAAYGQYLALAGKPHSTAIAARWVRANAATPLGVQSTQRVVRPVAAGPAAARENPGVTPRVVDADSARDIALLKVPGLVNAPSLGLDRGTDSGTPIATIGFGDGGPVAEPEGGTLVPSVRMGAMERTGEVDDEPRRVLTFITNDVHTGDSGGPAVDRSGRVRGVVLIRRAVGGGAMAPTDEILRVLDRAGVRGWEGRTQLTYREALDRVARFDLDGALTDLRRTLAGYPAHGLAGYGIAQVAELARARLALAGEPWYRGGLVAAGLTALMIAGVLGVLLWKAVNRSPGVLGPRDRKAPFDQEAGPDEH